MLEDGEGARAGFLVSGSGSKDTRGKTERKNNSQVTVCPRANTRSPLDRFCLLLNEKSDFSCKLCRKLSK